MNKIKHKCSRKHDTENFMKNNIKCKLIQKDHKMTNGLKNTPKMKNARKGRHKEAKTKFAYEYCDVCGDEFKFEIKNDKSPMKNSYNGENTVNGQNSPIRTNSHITNAYNASLNPTCSNKKFAHTHKVQDYKLAMQNSNRRSNLKVNHMNHPWTNYNSKKERNYDFNLKSCNKKSKCKYFHRNQNDPNIMKLLTCGEKCSGMTCNSKHEHMNSNKHFKGELHNKCDYKEYMMGHTHEQCLVTLDNPTYEKMIKNDGNNIWVADTGATCHMGWV